ncbi:MAG: cupredoxin domain-containing protein [Actinobacteria bacterium]|nr:cupredoxin domain-containing protein [Actinomycetota bacterium]
MSRCASAVLVLLLLTAACGGGNDSKSGDAKAATTTQSTAPPVTAEFGGVRGIVRGTSIAAEGLEVEVDDNYFRPNVIQGTARQSVTLVLASEGKSVHNFTLADQKVDVDIAAGQHASVKITLPASGDLVFFCKYHKDESGMVGAFRVSA